MLQISNWGNYRECVHSSLPCLWVDAIKTLTVVSARGLRSLLPSSITPYAGGEHKPEPKGWANFIQLETAVSRDKKLKVLLLFQLSNRFGVQLYHVDIIRRTSVIVPTRIMLLEPSFLRLFFLLRHSHCRVCSTESCRYHTMMALGMVCWNPNRTFWSLAELAWGDLIWKANSGNIYGLWTKITENWKINKSRHYLLKCNTAL